MKNTVILNNNLGEKKEILYKGYFYDVTNWIPNHPGGSIIKFYTSGGEDASQAIEQFHLRSEEKVTKILKTLKKRPATPIDCVLDSKSQKKYDALTKDYSDLFSQAKSEGLFEPDYVHVFQRFAEIVILATVSLYLSIFTNFWFTPATIVILLSLAGFRSGFLMHEYGHKSMTGNIKFDSILHSFVMGYYLGVSGGWWNSQHNRHHAMPQRIKHDVDLDTLPLLAFNSKIFKDPEKQRNFFIRHQAILFFFFDTFIVLTLWKYILSPRYCLKKGRYLDIFFMLLNLLTGIYLIGVGKWFLAEWIGSVSLFFNFTLNHSHLPVTTEPNHWVEYSLLYTANVNPSRFVNWWMGHLDFQIEHHLFPQMPQFKCSKISERVKALAAKHGLPYTSYSYLEGAKISWNNLKNVGQGH